MFFFIFTILTNIFTTADSVSINKYNTGVDYYNNKQYINSTAIFYSLWLKNPLDKKVKNSLTNSSQYLSIKPPTTLKYFLIPFKIIFFYIHLILLAIGILFYSIMLFIKNKISIKGNIFTITLLLLSFFSILIFYNLKKLQNIKRVYLLEDISLKDQPSFGADIVTEIRQGSILEIIEDRESWIKIESKNVTGWTKRNYIYYLNYGE